MPTENSNGGPPAAFPVIGSLVAIAGLIDSAYLTSKHYTGGEVPCSLISGCEQVLTSAYAEIFGIPTAMFGAAAYFVAFSLAFLSFYGHSTLWKVFGVLTILMAAFTVWLIYLQAFVIGAFCQFCLLSALSSTLLLITWLVSLFFPRS